MELVENAVAAVAGMGRRAPVGTVSVVDPSPLNWLWITYNTVEELVRVAPDGHIEPAAMSASRWEDDRTLEIDVREGERFPDGEPLTAATVERAFAEMMRWQSPHPPGTQFNLDPRTTCEATGERAVRFRLPEPDGGALGKLRAMHLMSSRFWGEVGFGYARTGSGEGHW